jgi:hypothetical protein
MTSEQKTIVISHTQFVARHYVALKTSIEKIVSLVRHSIGSNAPDADSISMFLRRDSTRKEFEYHHETALFPVPDSSKSWNLVCLAVQTDPAKARFLLERQPPSAQHCAFCWLDESRAASAILITERDLYGVEVSDIRLHPQCVKPWRALRRVLELEAIKNETF